MAETDSEHPNLDVPADFRHALATTGLALDFERGGRTELEALTGALVRMAEAKGVDVPASRIAYAILKLRERLEAGSRNGVGIATDRR